METQELYQLATWITKGCEETELDKYFQALTIDLEAYAKDEKHIKGAQYLNNKKNRLNQIANALKQFPEIQLTDDQATLMKSLDIDTLFNEHSLKTLHGILQKDHNFSFVISTIGNLNVSLKNALDKFSNILIYFKDLPYSSKKQDFKNPENKVFTRLTFKEKASISNFVELKTWSESWYNIARGYTIAQGKSPEEIEIIGAGNGSILIDLLANIETINMICETINHIADFTLTSIEAWASYEGMKYIRDNQKNSDKQQVYDELLKEEKEKIEQDHEDQFKRITDKLIKKYACKNECSNELKKAIKELSKFLDDGGNIKCITDSKSADNETEKALQESLKKFEKMKERLLLEDKNTGD
ncbi:hypothetical protein [Colwellia sp. 20A7]|uniref:hypothetical protein n=1 Tax=Colwellia sp. 20A7 TaxID=2689569 RepID=UPI00135A5E44|nr:hypothetical protein [Colwellia sp. 20A7]